MTQDDWLNFWFKPQLFMHESWFESLDGRLLNKASSALAWHLSFDYVCDVFRLSTEFIEVEEGLVQNILADLLRNDETVLDLAAMMMSTQAIDKSMSTHMRRKVLQRHRALSLKKRFLGICQSLTEREFGVYFVFLAVSMATHRQTNLSGNENITAKAPLWSRIRLLFPRETVEKIELAGKQVPRMAANDAAIRRAWREIMNLKHELKPEFAMTDADTTIAEIDMEAANDTEASVDETGEVKASSDPLADYVDEEPQAMAS